MVATPMLDEIQFSQAKARLSAIMDEVVHREHPKVVRRERGSNELMYLLPREVIEAVVGAARVTVDYLPDEEGIGLWVNDLEIGAHGADVVEARAHLVREVRAYVANFIGELPVYLTWPDRARLLPQVLRLAVARDDDELARLLFAHQSSTLPAREARRRREAGDATPLGDGATVNLLDVRREIYCGCTGNRAADAEDRDRRALRSEAGDPFHG